MNILDTIKESGFKTPENYFNSLEERISAENFNKSKPTNMQVPEGYFEGLENRIMNTLSNESILDKNIDSGLKIPEGYLTSLQDTISIQTKKETKVINLFSKRNLFLASSIAAAIILMLSLFTNNNKITFENIDVDLVEDYLIDQNIDSYELASLLNDEDLSTENFIDSDIFSEAVEDYLIDNTDIEELMNE